MSNPLANMEAEQGLLGAILVNPDALARVESIVTANDFAETIHKDLFARLVEVKGWTLLRISSSDPGAACSQTGTTATRRFTAPTYLRCCSRCCLR